MFHLDNNSGVSAMPAPGAVQSKAPRWFTEGGNNAQASWPGMDWFNIVQAELLGVLTEGKVNPNKAQFNQLALAIKNIISANSNVKNALLKDNNLSDVEDITESRNNLGLGNAAVKDIVTSMTDTTSGRLPVIGWMGWGGPEIGIPDKTDIHKFFATAASGNYGGGNDLASVVTTGYHCFKWQQHGSDHKYGILYEVGSTGGRMAVHIYSNPNGDMVNPQNYWTTSEFLQLSGGSMTGPIKLPITGRGSWASQYNFDAPLMQEAAFNETSSNYWPITKQKLNITGAKPYSYAVSTGVLTSTTEQISWNVQIIGSGGQNYILAFKAENGGRLAVPEQVIPGNYGNFDARYVSDSRLGARNYRLMTKGTMFEIAGNVITGLQIEGEVDGNGDYIVMRPLQKLINGTWYTVAQV